MKAESLLLPKFLGHGKIQRHEGQVVTLRSNTRWCSDSFQFRCWDGEKIEAAFVLDTCDREIIAITARVGTLRKEDISDLLVAAVEHRYPKTLQAPGNVQWLTDNGGIFTADMTSRIATELGLIPCRTPAYCPESNGMSESFVKRFKQDYVYLNEIWQSDKVVEEIHKWAEDYNENHPHKGLKMLSPREFRRAST